MGSAQNRFGSSSKRRTRKLSSPNDVYRDDRELKMLAEATGALKRLLDGQGATWLERDILRTSWAMCQVRGIQPDDESEALA